MAVISARGVHSGRPEANNEMSQREDLANFISMITRDETPFISSIGRTKATAMYHEWQTDEFVGPVEGFTNTFNALIYEPLKKIHDVSYKILWGHSQQ